MAFASKSASPASSSLSSLRYGLSSLSSLIFLAIYPYCVFPCLGNNCALIPGVKSRRFLVGSIRRHEFFRLFEYFLALQEQPFQRLEVYFDLQRQLNTFLTYIRKFRSADYRWPKDACERHKKHCGKRSLGWTHIQFSLILLLMAAAIEDLPHFSSSRPSKDIHHDKTNPFSANGSRYRQRNSRGSHL